MEALAPTCMYYVIPHLHRIVYTDHLLYALELHIDSLDRWPIIPQLVEVEQQGLLVELQVVKTDTHLHIVSLYVYTRHLDALNDLEEDLLTRLQARYANYADIQQQALAQSRQLEMERTAAILQLEEHWSTYQW